jgi:hypothetical protein
MAFDPATGLLTLCEKGRLQRISPDAERGVPFQEPDREALLLAVEPRIGALAVLTPAEQLSVRRGPAQTPTTTVHALSRSAQDGPAGMALALLDAATSAALRASCRRPASDIPKAGPVAESKAPAPAASGATLWAFLVSEHSIDVECVDLGSAAAASNDPASAAEWSLTPWPGPILNCPDGYGGVEYLRGWQSVAADADSGTLLLTHDRAVPDGPAHRRLCRSVNERL